MHWQSNGWLLTEKKTFSAQDFLFTNCDCSLLAKVASFFHSFFFLIFFAEIYNFFLHVSLPVLVWVPQQWEMDFQWIRHQQHGAVQFDLLQRSIIRHPHLPGILWVLPWNLNKIFTIQYELFPIRYELFPIRCHMYAFEFDIFLLKVSKFETVIKLIVLF